MWKFDTSFSWVLGSAAVTDDRVYLGTSDTDMMRAIDAATGAEIFSAPLGSCVYSSPALVGETVYVGTCAGVLFAVDATNGDIRWQFRTDASVEDRHGLLGPDGEWDFGRIFTDEYSAANAAAGVERFLDLGTFLSSPVVLDGVLYIGSTDGHLYALANR